ncbi:alpha/beta fold hydrolase [Rhodococcus sp. MEB064]|uniref:alpha/beta fold hydrolase n=1 Tax=Rhodococcus sp. MEB064 TaxID=1587522 RepID=UPI0005AD12C9|nr:alpha/beta hydrolase [Rhodococcus sp. MEB064]KIQ10970.1 peroxidase [Rhodococcus sp. MEB064]
MSTVTVSDGTVLHYREQGAGRPLVLLHGWGFSGEFFSGSMDRLAEHSRVIALDMRAHGGSEDPGHGYRVSRLAKDLFDVLAALDLADVTVLGWSLGCPVIWSYQELFGNERLAQAIYVAQTPRQYRTPEWSLAHTSIFDDASLAAVQGRVLYDRDNFDAEQLDEITATDLPADRVEILHAEMAKMSGAARNAVMADHTHHDWRDLLPTLDLPSLVMVGKHDKAFPWEAARYVGDTVPGARTVLFEDSSHALFLDEPQKFEDEVVAFLAEHR